MDRKTIIAFVMIGLVVVSMPYYFKLVNPEPPQSVQDSLAALAAAQEAASAMGGNSATPGDVTRGGQTQSDTPLAAGMDTPGSNRIQDVAADTSGVPARTITVRTPLYEAEFSTRGATIHSWTVLPTQPYLGEPEQLVIPDVADENLTLTALGGLGLLRTKDQVFAVDGLENGELELHKGDGPDSLVFHLPLGEDRWYRETYVFDPERYAVQVHLASRGLGATTGAVSASFGWGGGLAMTEQNDVPQDLHYMKAYWMIGTNKESLDGGKKEEEKTATGATEWVGVRSKYFLMALVPEEPAAGARLRTWPGETIEGGKRQELYGTDLVFNIPEGDIDRKMTLYLGPLEMEHLDRIDPSLDEIMSWGWPIISFFSKLIFHILVWLHNFIPNYGVILIIFAVMVKIVVWPLTYKSHQSMKRMQMIQPLMKELQTKYKEDPQRMQKEVMGLYKEHKVNPMGGCWPMLLQMPLLYALFIVFRSTIELRNQPFMLWITDLSMPDVLISLPFALPLYGDHIALLPLAMAVSMYLQSKTTATDPNQKMMTIMMPIMMIFIFNNFPSGLTLYYTMFNLLHWVQTKLMKTGDPALEKALADRELEKEKEIERQERREAKKQRKS